MRQNFAEKVVIITGASSGIGLETALLFAQQGAKLVLAARREDRLQELAERIKNLGAEAYVVAVDLSDSKQAELLIEKTIAHYGKLDILVNNAGFGQQMFVHETNPEDIHKIFSVNVLSLIIGTKTAIPHLQKTSGMIINVSSIAGLIPMPLNSLYSATKHALVGFNRSMMSELSHMEIKMATVCPGPVQTEFMDVMEGRKFPNWLMKNSWMFMDSPITIAKGIVKVARRRSNGVRYASFRSRFIAYSYLMCPPISQFVYRWYIGKMKK